MKKYILVLASIALTLNFSSFQASYAFSDVPDSHQYSEAIGYLEDFAIIQGYPDGSFKPDININRAEFTKIVIGAYFDPTEIQNCQDQPSLSDLESNTWYSPFICIATSEQIIQGYPDGTFRPDKPINYAEAAKIISITESLFTDNQITSETEPWYLQFTDNIESKQAKPQTIQSPSQFLTRGEMSYIIAQIDQSLNSDTFAMTEADCFPQETYDPVEKVCYYECLSDEECTAIEDEIAKQAAAIGDDYFDGDKTYQPIDQPSTPQIPEEQDEQDLVTYIVSGNEIASPQTTTITDPQLKTLQEDTAKHQEIWKLFTTLIPLEKRNSISQFIIFTDGKEGALAAVTQNEQDPTKWILIVDITDAYPNGTIDKNNLTFSLIHEFGHIITLNVNQVPIDQELFYTNDLDEDQYNDLIKQKEAACSPKFFIDEGCSAENSYINQFFQNYWKSIYPEFTAIQSDEEFDTFLQKYQNHFVTDYASTNPVEDIAESWTAFVLKAKPTGDSIADQKTNFFYQFPELVKLRNVIRSRLNN